MDTLEMIVRELIPASVMSRCRFFRVRGCHFAAAAGIIKGAKTAHSH